MHFSRRSRPFEYLVLLTIFCNCAALALSKPLPNNDTTPTNSILVSNRIYTNDKFHFIVSLKRCEEKNGRERRSFDLSKSIDENDQSIEEILVFF